ncbi:hypothetical protein ABZ202_20115 [Streptomyces sp. NPDC006186]|uniref:hypothetical protein n=1 Tax=Streptomyces sp. NPDC006186 TaxID=3155248 RepID=UPI0033B72818
MSEAGPPMRETGAVFERVLDRALDCRQVRDALDRAQGALSREHLRRRARQARSAISEAAEPEYREYLRTRSAAEAAQGARGVRSGPAEGREDEGAPQAVRASVVAAGAAALLLPTGYGLSAFGGHPYIGGGLVTAGLIAGSLAVGAGAGDLLWQRLTRTGARTAAPSAPSAPASAEDADRAREAWERALLERGLVPFLLGRLEEAGARRRS